MSVDRKVLAFIKLNPGATPREIADGLGLPYNTVRGAILRLREAGYLIRSSRGGYVVRVGLPSSVEDELTPAQVSRSQAETLAELKTVILDLREAVEELTRRVDRLEKELNLLKKGIQPKHPPRPRERGDPLLKELRRSGVIKLGDAARLAREPLENYFKRGLAVPVGGLIISAEFLERFKKRFPLSMSEVQSLSREEKELLNEMTREGLIYLHGGREYRLIE